MTKQLRTLPTSDARLSCNGCPSPAPSRLEPISDFDFRFSTPQHECCRTEHAFVLHPQVFGLSALGASRPRLAANLLAVSGVAIAGLVLLRPSRPSPFARLRAEAPAIGSIQSPTITPSYLPEEELAPDSVSISLCTLREWLASGVGLVGKPGSVGTRHRVHSSAFGPLGVVTDSRAGSRLRSSRSFCLDLAPGFTRLRASWS